MKFHDLLNLKWNTVFYLLSSENGVVDLFVVRFKYIEGFKFILVNEFD